MSDLFIYIFVPIMLLISSILMAFAWLGHLRFKEYPLYIAVLFSWMIVLPEYALNVLAIRLGHSVFTGAAMATFNICSGIICVSLISSYYLKERLRSNQIFGFFILIVAMTLVLS